MWDCDVSRQLSLLSKLLRTSGNLYIHSAAQGKIDVQSPSRNYHRKFHPADCQKSSVCPRCRWVFPGRFVESSRSFQNIIWNSSINWHSVQMPRRGRWHCTYNVRFFLPNSVCEERRAEMKSTRACKTGGGNIHFLTNRLKEYLFPATFQADDIIDIRLPPPSFGCSRFCMVAPAGPSSLTEVGMLPFLLCLRS